MLEPCTASAAVMAPGPIIEDTEGNWLALYAPPASMTSGYQKQQRRPMVAVVLTCTCRPLRLWIEAVGMPVRCSSTCLTTLESLSAWAMNGSAGSWAAARRR